MAKRSNEPGAPPTAEVAEARPPPDAATVDPAKVAPDEAPVVVPGTTVDPHALAGETAPTPLSIAPSVTVEERFVVETSIYHVPHLGFGAIFVPAGTVVTRSSHDVQKLIEQGAKLRPVLD